MTGITTPHLGIIGLGYVGLPLAVAFGKKLDTIGFDINARRIERLNQGTDDTLELTSKELNQAGQLNYSTDPEALRACNTYIVTVPTPIDEYRRPDLHPLEAASELVGKVISRGDVVIYESTVYPGCTEEICIPIIEKVSGLKYNQDFYAGYSPERINPGDKSHRIENITKVTSGSTAETARYVDELYGQIVEAGTHQASSIMVAEAAKVIENTQRDVNIALINELAQIFDRLGIDTLEVLEAAGSKWNFLPFRPGLVGGHCIGVDPYYLTHKAQAIGHHPEIIMAGRRLNDSVGEWITDKVLSLMTQNRINVVDSRVLVMGLTFKENCPDLRNTRVIDIVHGLSELHVQVDVHDPWADPEEAKALYDLNLVNEPAAGAYDAAILCVAHDQFKAMGIGGIKRFVKSNHVIYDVKSILPVEEVQGRL
jgi:UDP-N-acetyl-D-galactosamine dehydrogenase